MVAGAILICADFKNQVEVTDIAQTAFTCGVLRGVLRYTMEYLAQVHRKEDATKRTISNCGPLETKGCPGLWPSLSYSELEFPAMVQCARMRRP